MVKTKFYLRDNYSQRKQFKTYMLHAKEEAYSGRPLMSICKEKA